MNPRCKEIEPLLTRYLLKDLELQVEARVREHVAGCSRCQATLRDVEPTLQLLRSALTARTDAPAQLDAERRLRVLAATTRETRRFQIPWRRLGEIAAVLVVLFVLASLITPSFMRARTNSRLGLDLGVQDTSPSTEQGELVYAEGGPQKTHLDYWQQKSSPFSWIPGSRDEEKEKISGKFEDDESSRVADERSKVGDVAKLERGQSFGQVASYEEGDQAGWGTLGEKTAARPVRVDELKFSDSKARDAMGKQGEKAQAPSKSAPADKAADSSGAGASADEVAGAGAMHQGFMSGGVGKKAPPPPAAPMQVASAPTAERSVVTVTVAPSGRDSGITDLREKSEEVQRKIHESAQKDIQEQTRIMGKMGRAAEAPKLPPEVAPETSAVEPPSPARLQKARSFQTSWSEMRGREESAVQSPAKSPAPAAKPAADRGQIEAASELGEVTRRIKDENGTVDRLKANAEQPVGGPAKSGDGSYELALAEKGFDGQVRKSLGKSLEAGKAGADTSDVNGTLREEVEEATAGQYPVDRERVQNQEGQSVQQAEVARIPLVGAISKQKEKQEKKSEDYAARGKAGNERLDLNGQAQPEGHARAGATGGGKTSGSGDELGLAKVGERRDSQVQKGLEKDRPAFKAGEVAQAKEGSEIVNRLRDDGGPAAPRAGISENRSVPIDRDGHLITEAPQGSEQRRELINKLNQIRIPELNFRSANIEDVVKFLSQASAANDANSASTEKGVNIVLNLRRPGQPAGEAAAPMPISKSQEDIFGDVSAAPAGVEATVPGASRVPEITLNLRNITMGDALKYVTEVTSLKYRIEDDGRVVITPADVVWGEVITRMYSVKPSVMEAIIGRPDAKTESGQSDAVSKFFQDAGVPYPQGTSIIYKPSIGKLIVANTAENLEKFENTLAKLNEASTQAEAVSKPAEPVLKPKFKPAAFNPFVEASGNPFSTFSIDVDTASYTLCRNYMLNGKLPPPEAARTEEFVNFFDYAYPAPVERTFAVKAECAPTPFGRGTQWLRIGVKGRHLGREENRPSALTLLIDTSGSMSTPDRMGLLKQALRLLVDKLGPNDRVAVVQYDSHARLVLEHTPVAEKAKILEAIERLDTTGSTNLEEGMNLAYATAARAFLAGGINQVLILSDGAANLGAVAAEDILKRVDAYRRQGIQCSVYGFGMGTYDDAMLETLADKGDGRYVFIDSLDEARRVFVDELSATLNVIASDVKIQVEFNPARVKRYRQLGYENRALTKEQFRDDKVDAGEVGSGQSVTALYELELSGEGRGESGEVFSDQLSVISQRPTPNAQHPTSNKELRSTETEVLGTVRLRYRDARTGKIEEIAEPLTSELIRPQFEQASSSFRLAAGVAAFSELVRGSPYAAANGYPDVARVLRPIALELKLDTRLQELLRLVEKAESMPRAE